MFNVSSLLLDDALKNLHFTRLLTQTGDASDNDAINQTLRQLVPLTAPELSWLSTFIKHLWKSPFKQHSRRDLSLGCLEATC